MLFRTRDPAGRSVALDETCYQKHIVRDHSDVVPDWIEETIQDPDFITQDSIKRKRVHLCLSYYKLGILPESYRGLFLKVIAAQAKPEACFYVRSAYPAHHIKLDQEEIIWTRLSPSGSK